MMKPAGCLLLVRPRKVMAKWWASGLPPGRSGPPLRAIALLGYSVRDPPVDLGKKAALQRKGPYTPLEKKIGGGESQGSEISHFEVVSRKH